MGDGHRTPVMATPPWYHSIYDIHMTQLPSLVEIVRTNTLNTKLLSWPTACICSQKVQRMFVEVGSYFQACQRLFAYACLLCFIHLQFLEKLSSFWENLIVNLVFSHVVTGSCQVKQENPTRDITSNLAHLNSLEWNKNHHETLLL